MTEECGALTRQELARKNYIWIYATGEIGLRAGKTRQRDGPRIRVSSDVRGASLQTLHSRLWSAK